MGKMGDMGEKKTAPKRAAEKNLIFVAQKHKARRLHYDLRLEEGSRIKKQFNFIKPMFSTLVDEPFDHKEWLFEIKWDGYRAISIVKKGSAEIFSRRGLRFRNFGIIEEQLGRLGLDAVLDGEIIAVDEFGKSDFQSLQNYKNARDTTLIYYVFDILQLKNKDLKDLPLEQRKQILFTLLGGMNGAVRFAGHLEEKGKKMFETAKTMGIEGIMAKKRSSKYEPGRRVKNWLKIKALKRQEAVIFGVTEPRGQREAFGSLVLGAYENGKPLYIGQSGGGFTNAELNRLKKKFEKYKTGQPAFENPPLLGTKITWLKPEFVCEVKFSEWTSDGKMRHPIYLGIRADKKPTEVVIEKPQSKELFNPEIKETQPGKKEHRNQFRTKVKLTHLDKTFWPRAANGSGSEAREITKNDLLQYYNDIAGFILPYLKDRPQSLRRYPNGIISDHFFQKNITSHPGYIRTEKIASDSKGFTNYLTATDKDSLLYMINLGCIDLNPWNSRIDKIDYPDYLVIDLDPVEITFEAVIETAKNIRKILDKAEVESFPKTSGGNGIHIFIPLGAKYETSLVLDFAHILSQVIRRKIPGITSLERMPDKRKSKVYLDYLQNRQGATNVSAYSVRPRLQAPVSAPLEWNEVKKGMRPENFTLRTMRGRLDKKGDLWKGVLGRGIDMKKALEKIAFYP